MSDTDYIDIIFDGPPSHESGRFVEVENSAGKSINFGEWIERPDGYWALRIPHGAGNQIAELRAKLTGLYGARLTQFCDELADGDLFLSDFDSDLIDRLRRAIR